MAGRVFTEGAILDSTILRMSGLGSELIRKRYAKVEKKNSIENNIIFFLGYCNAFII